MFPINKSIMPNNRKNLITWFLVLFLFTGIRCNNGDSNYKLLIIAPREFVPPLQSLLDHKKATGIGTKLLNLDNIYTDYRFDGCDEPEEIKKAIEHYKKKYNIKYVLLVGDCNKFPVRWQCGNFVDSNYDIVYLQSDYYYADLYNESGRFNDWDADNDRYYGEIYRDELNQDNIDYHADVVVARIPAADITQLESCIAKIIRYEYKTYDSDWFKRLLLIQKDWPDDVDAQEYIAEYLNDFDFATIRLYQNAGYSGTIDGIPNSNHISHNINRGMGFVSHLYHSHPGDWDYMYNINNIRRDLNNHNMLPLIYSNGCQTTQFFKATLPYDNYLDEHGIDQAGVGVGTVGSTYSEIPACIQSDRFNEMSIGEAFLVENDNGAVAYFGCSETGEPEFHKLLNKSFFTAYRPDNNILGDMWRHAIEQFVDDYRLPDISPDSWHPTCKMHTPSRFLLFGDPSLRVGGIPDIVDNEPPVTTDDATGDWQNMVTLTSVDHGSPPSGVKETTWRVLNGVWQTGNHIAVPGSNTIEYYSVDFLNNIEEIKTPDIKIDIDPPMTEILLNGERPIIQICPCPIGYECDCPRCYEGSVTVSFNASDVVSGVAFTAYYFTTGPNPYHCRYYCTYTNPFEVRRSTQIKYWSVDNAGNWEESKLTYFCIAPSFESDETGIMRARARMIGALKEIISMRMSEEFISALPNIKSIDYEYANQEHPFEWREIGFDEHANNGWGVSWNTNSVPNGNYLIRLTVRGFLESIRSTHDDVVSQKQFKVKVCNIPDSAYKFKLSAPKEIEKKEIIEYFIEFENKIDSAVTNVKMTCDLDTALFKKIDVYDNGSLNQIGLPSWFKEKLKSGETWKVRFKALTKDDIYPGLVITSQAFINADNIPLLLSDDMNTEEREDYTAVTIKPITGLVGGKIMDDKYNTPLKALVSIVGIDTQQVISDENGCYSFANLLPGVYKVSVAAESYGYRSPIGPVRIMLNSMGDSAYVNFF